MLALSHQEEAILELLLSGQELYGLDLIEKSNNELKPGTIYVHLSNLEKNKLVSSRLEALKEGEQGKPRRLYQITNFGLTLYNYWQSFK